MARYFLLALGLLLIWLTNAWGGPSEGAADYDELRAEGERSAGTIVRLQEREVTQRGRRGRTRTYLEHCPEVRYRETVGDQEFRTSFIEYDACDREDDDDADRWSVGDEVTVLWNDDGARHINSDAVRGSLASDERSHSSAKWIGYGAVALTVPLILWGWYRRVAGRRR